MHSVLIAFLLALTGFGRAEAQADALFSLLEQSIENNTELQGTWLAVDNDDNLWVIGFWGQSPNAMRIDKRGKIILQKTPAPDQSGGTMFAEHIYVDRWNNVYFAYAGYQSAPNVIPIHLVRVTPEGSFRDYSPWPNLTLSGSIPYMDILPGDTLITLGPTGPTRTHVEGEVKYRLVKGIVDSSGTITPVHDEVHPWFNMPIMIELQRSNNSSMLDWNHGWGLWISIPPKGSGTEAQNQLTLHTLDLRIPVENRGIVDERTYNWRDYIWRSYEDSPIDFITFAPYEDEGYIICIPDPRNGSITQMLRVDREGVLLEPSELKDGGTRYPRPFDRLSSTFKRYSRFERWYDYYCTLDSARVIFWGCDDKGNLYSSSKTKRY